MVRVLYDLCVSCLILAYSTFSLTLSLLFPSLILTYAEGVEMLHANGVEMGDEDDLRYCGWTGTVGGQVLWVESWDNGAYKGVW